MSRWSSVALGEPLESSWFQGFHHMGWLTRLELLNHNQVLYQLSYSHHVQVISIM